MPYGGAGWLCRCDCGNETRVGGGALRRGTSTSCGCSCTAKLVTRATTHGLHKHPLYRAWSRMKDRCYYEKHRYYADYGGRGIEVCPRWRDDFQSFYDDNLPAWREGLELDRIQNDGPYSPENCRWSTKTEQGRNKRNNVFLTLEGQSKLLLVWAEELGIPANTLRVRRAHGWSDAQCLLTPYGQRPSV